MFHRYRYEADIYPALSRIPLHVRMKLDLTGLKISLNEWLAFSMEERTVLCHFPIEAEEEKQAFSSYVDFLSRKHRGEPVATVPAMNDSLWNTSGDVPEPVLQRCAGKADPINVEEWRHWKSHQRYALYKTAISKSEPEVFYALLAEFRDGGSRRRTSS